MSSLIEDQLELRPDLLSELNQKGFRTTQSLVQRSRGEIYCLLLEHHGRDLEEIERSLDYRGLCLRTPEGPNIPETVGVQKNPGPWAAKILTRHRLRTLEELEFLGRKRVREIMAIGPGSIAVIDDVMRSHHLKW